MGFELARTAKRRGADVVLISGPTSMASVPNIKLINITTALQMHDAVMKNFPHADIVVMAAAVSDYRPEQTMAQKVKKGDKFLELKMKPNPDILKKLGAHRKKKNGRPLLVGFAAESKDHLEEGRRKLMEKKLDLIVINDILGADTGFGSDTNQISLIDREYELEKLPLLPKEDCADIIWDRILKLLQ